MSKKKRKVVTSTKAIANNFKGKLSIVIPCYNEQKRATKLIRVLRDFHQKWKRPLQIIAVDDGSSDQTGAALEKAGKDAFSDNTSFEVVHLSENQGKGGALKAGVARADGDFVLTMDADCATQPHELLRWLRQLPGKTFKQNQILIGSREHSESEVEGQAVRRVAGLTFNFIIQLFTNLNLQDTQCGFKLYPQAVAKKLFGELGTNGWAHDVELLYQAELDNIGIQSMPIRWKHQDDSKISLLSDSIKMFWQSLLISIRLKWRHFISEPIAQLSKKTEAGTEPSYFRLLFVVLSLLLLIGMPMLSFDFGVTGDEEVQKVYGEKILSYFESNGEDDSALNYKNLYFYGGLFDYIAAWCNKYIGWWGEYELRHVLNALTGFFMIFFTGKLARELSGSWKLGFLALLFMALSPRIFGHAMNNPKDIPFAAAYVFSLLYLVRFIKQLPRPATKTVILLTIGIAAAINVRVGGILLIAYFGLFTGISYLWRSDLRKQLAQPKSLLKILGIGLFVAVGGYFAGMLYWPYAQQAPLSNPFKALSEMSNFSIGIRMLFEGDHLWSDELPWYYIPKWILISAPLFILAGLGLFVTFFVLRFKKINVWPWLFVTFTGIFPMAYAIFKGSSLYDGMRHFLFIYPIVAILAAWGWHTLSSRFEQKAVRWGLTIVLAVLMALPTGWMLRNHPYQYTYFNKLAGGTKAAYGRYETDYWMNSMKELCEWLAGNAEDVKSGKEVKVYTNCSVPLKYYLGQLAPNVKVKYTRYRNRHQHKADYYMFYSRFVNKDLLLNDAWPPAETVYEAKAGDITLAAISKNPQNLDAQAYEAEKSKDFDSAIRLYEQEINRHPKNEAATLALANSYIATQQYPQAQATLDKLFKLSPTYNNGLFAQGVYYVQTQQQDKARQTFERVVDLNYKYSSAYYYLTSIAAQENRFGDALKYMDLYDREGGNVAQAYQMGIQLAKQKGDKTRELYYSAKLSYVQGNYQESMKQLQQALSYDRDYEPAVKLDKAFKEAIANQKKSK